MQNVVKMILHFPLHHNFRCKNCCWYTEKGRQRKHSFISNHE